MPKVTIAELNQSMGIDPAKVGTDFQASDLVMEKVLGDPNAREQLTYYESQAATHLRDRNPQSKITK